MFTDLQERRVIGRLDEIAFRIDQEQPHIAALALARGDGRYTRLIKSLARTDLLILDDWGPEKLNDEQRRDLLEIIEDRYERRSTIITSQIPVDHWYDMIGNATIADAILDRLVHNAYRIELSGESLRKQRTVSMSDTTFA